MKVTVGAMTIAVVLAAQGIGEERALAQDHAPMREMDPEATAQPPAPTPPDVVKLRNGSMYRGTVMELVAGDHVDVRLPSGETKRFAASDVEYAGPASRAPDATPAVAPPPGQSAAPQAQQAKVHLEVRTSDTEFHVRVGDATAVGWSPQGSFVVSGRSYAPLCTPPCDLTLPFGRYRLALSHGDGPPREPDQAITIKGPTAVEGTYISYRGTRFGGWFLFATSLLGGSLLCTAGAVTPGPGQPTNMTLVGTGVGVAVVGSVIGLIFATQRDRIYITATPD